MRDDVDNRAVANASERTSTVGTNGIIDWSELKTMDRYEYKGTPKADSDGDGIRTTGRTATDLIRTIRQIQCIFLQIRSIQGIII